MGKARGDGPGMGGTAGHGGYLSAMPHNDASRASCSLTYGPRVHCELKELADATSLRRLRAYVIWEHCVVCMEHNGEVVRCQWFPEDGHTAIEHVFEIHETVKATLSLSLSLPAHSRDTRSAAIPAISS
jgi:hypothetical protein